MTVTAAAVERLARSLQHTWLKGKYRVDKLLGYGGAACVFAVTHRNGHRAAIKLLHPSVATDASSRSRFLREGYLANKVEHRGAVHVLDDDVLDDGSVFLVMELLSGDTLDDRAEAGGGKLPLKTVCRATYQLLDVLAAAHDRGIVHRDIKPQNLFWTKEGLLKVLDFGLARLELPGAQVLTQTGEVFGTPAFMGPEQAIGDMDRVGPASDQWSAAATFFTLVTGAFVHDAKTPTEMIVHTATRPPRSIREVDPTIPVRIGNVVDRALRFRPEERWPHVSDFQRALKLAYEAEIGGSLSMPTLAPVSVSSFPAISSAKGRPAALSVAIASVAAAAVLAAGVFAIRALRADVSVNAPEPAAAVVEAPQAVAPAAMDPAAPEVAPDQASPTRPASDLASSATESAAARPPPSTGGTQAAPPPTTAKSKPSADKPAARPRPPKPKPDPWSAQ